MKKSIINIFNKKLKTIDIKEINRIKVDLRDLTPQNIKFILQKLPKDRTDEEIAFLKNFILLKTSFSDKLNEEHIDEESQNIITILSMQNAFYKEIKNKEELIYDINDETKNFFIILHGKVAVYDIEKVDCEINMEKYYKMILNFLKIKEKYLLERTIKENKVNIPIDLNHVNKLNKILLKIYLLSKTSFKFYKNNPKFLDEIFEKLGFKYSDFGIESYEHILDKNNQKIKNENTEEKLLTYNINEALKISKANEDKVLENLNLEIPDNLCKKYLFLIRKDELPVSYFRYKEKKILEVFDYFGDNFNGLSKEKIVTKSNNLELLCFKNDIYNEYDLNIKTKYAGTQDQFLLNNFFMNSITKPTFEKVYLKFFEYKKFYSNQIIIEENETIEYIYFIKSGNIKIFSNRSIIQNHLLIQIIINIMKRKCPNIDNSKSNFKAYSDMKADFDKIKTELNFNKKIHIMNFTEKQCIGFECFYFGFNSLYSAIAFSEKVELYRISIDKLYKILGLKNKKALYEFAIMAEKTLKILLERLIAVNNILIVNYLKKNENVLKEAGDFMEREIFLNQLKKEEMVGSMNIKHPRIKEQKHLEQSKSCYFNNNFYNIKERNGVLSCPKRNSRLDLKKSFKFNRNKLINNFQVPKKVNKIYDTFGINIKLFDYKENLEKQRNREILRESIELERLSNEENRKINFLKLQNKISKDFIRLSKGEKRIFINSSNSDLNLSSIRHNYSFKKRNIFLISKNKLKTLKPFNKETKKREFFPKIDTTVERNNNLESINDMIVNSKWIELDKAKFFENSSSNSEKEITSKEKVNVFRKSSDGKKNIYKKFVVKEV